RCGSTQRLLFSRPAGAFAIIENTTSRKVRKCCPVAVLLRPVTPEPLFWRALMFTLFPTPHLGRRDLLASLGAAAGGFLFAEAVGADANPGAAVPDGSSSIRIRSLKATSVRGHIFVKIDTNQGVFGWGETAGLEPKAATALLQSLFELLDGENPTRIEYLW